MSSILVAPSQGDINFATGSFADKESAQAQRAKLSREIELNNRATAYVKSNFLTSWYYRWRLTAAQKRYRHATMLLETLTKGGK